MHYVQIIILIKNNRLNRIYISQQYNNLEYRDKITETKFEIIELINKLNHCCEQLVFTNMYMTEK